MPLILGYLFIFFARVIDMVMASLRVLMLMRGRYLAAAIYGFFESAIFILAVSKVIGSMDDPLSVFFYAFGFAAGNYVGGHVEEKIAVGFVSAQIVSLTAYEKMEEELREAGFGVTTLEGCGKDGPHKVLFILLKRKDQGRLMQLVNKIDPDAFLSLSDAKKIRGGFFPRRKIK